VAIQVSTQIRSIAVITRIPETCLAASTSFSPKVEFLKATPYQTFGRHL